MRDEHALVAVLIPKHLDRAPSAPALEPAHRVAVLPADLDEQEPAGAHVDRRTFDHPADEIEAIAQVAGILMLRVLESTGKIAYFMSAEDVKWRKPVRPGDVLIIDVTLTKMRGKIGKAKGTCLVDGDVVSEAEVTFMLMDR